MSVASRVVAAARWLRSRRRYECPRCRFMIPNTVARCPRCGWIDRSTTMNLEAYGGVLSHRGDFDRPGSW